MEKDKLEYLMNNVKKKIVVTCLFFSLVFLISCKDNNKYIQRNNPGKELFNYIKEYKNKELSYYSSSTYKPSDDLYLPVLAIQRKRWDIAIPLLEKLVDKNDPDAMYWLASISGGSIFSGYKMADLFKRSAMLGNPYSALRLDINADDCDSYLRGYCDEKWGIKARKILEDRSKKGDYKSEYYLQVLDKSKYRKDLDLAIKNAKNNYYYPLYDYLIYNSDISKDIRKYLYRIMINARYSRVGQLMSYNFDIDNFSYSFYENGLDYLVGSGGVWSSIFGINRKFLEKQPDARYVRKIALSYFVMDMIKGSSDLNNSFKKKDIKSYDMVDYLNSSLKNDKLPIVSDSEKKQIANEALNNISNTKPVIYIDEFFYKP